MDDPGEKRGFRQGHFAEILVEVRQRSLAKSVNREAAAVPEIDFIGVELENLLLVEAVLEFQRYDRFGNLAPPGPVRAEKEAARHLHRDRAAALNARPVAQVGPGRAQNPDRIESRMLEKAPVFHGKHGIAQNLRNIVVADGAALLAGAVKQARQKFRLNLGGIQRGSILHGADLLDFGAAEIHDQPVFCSKIRLAGRADFDFVAMQDVTPRRPRNVQFAVTRALQVIGHIRQGKGFAGIDPHGSGINLGCRLLNMPGKTQIDHPAIGNPVIRPHAGCGKEKKNRSPKKDQPKPGSPETPANSNTQGSSPFRREKTLCGPQEPNSPLNA